MFLPLYKKIKKAVLALLPDSFDEQALSSNELLLRLRQDRYLDEANLEDLKLVLSSTLSFFKDLKENFPEQVQNFKVIHERMLRFDYPTEKEFFELLERYDRIEERFVQQLSTGSIRAELDLSVERALYHEARRFSSLKQGWILPDWRTVNNVTHRQVMLAMTQKYPTVGLNGACYGIAIVAMAEILKTGSLNRRTFAQSLLKERVIDKVATAQEHQAIEGATDISLLEVLEPELVDNVSKMSSVFMQMSQENIVDYVRELASFPKEGPLVLVIKSWMKDLCHTVLLYYEVDKGWKLFDSNHLLDETTSSDELSESLYASYWKQEEALLSVSTYSLASRAEHQVFFQQHQERMLPKMLSFLRDEGETARKEAILHFFQKQQDYHLFTLLFNAGVDPNYKSGSLFVNFIMSGDLRGLDVFLSEELAIPVSSENLGSLLRLLETEKTPLRQEEKDHISVCIQQELKGRRLINALENKDLCEVCDALTDNSIPLSPRHAHRVTVLIETIEMDAEVMETIKKYVGERSASKQESEVVQSSGYSRAKQ